MRHIPNFITLMNLLAGLLAVYFALHGMYYFAAFLVLAGAVFDFFDGFAARLLKVSSPVGAELDSLSDLVTFGAAPAFMLVHILQIRLAVTAQTPWWELATTFVPLILVLFSALRLAKFNVDDTQSVDFKGVPTPANALFQVSFSFLLIENPQLITPAMVYPVIVVMALLLVMPVQLMGLKKFNGDRKYFIAALLAVSAILLIIFRETSGVFIILFYIVLSGVRWFFNKPARN